jgi:hypothetical protein
MILGVSSFSWTNGLPKGRHSKCVEYSALAESIIWLKADTPDTLECSASAEPCLLMGIQAKESIWD